MAQLAIKGHTTRGEEVIETLAMVGGNNAFGNTGDNPLEVYWISDIYKNFIICSDAKNVHSCIIFSLEEFLEKFPYKVGDEVIAYAEGCLAKFTIQDIRWNSESDKVEYKICSSWIDASLIMQRYKEMEENFGGCIEKTVQEYLFGKKETTGERKYADLRLDVDQDDKLATEVTIDGDKITPPENYLIGKITKVDNGMLVEFVKKQPKYPKTYKDCCDVLGLSTMDNDAQGYKGDLIIRFQELLIARDAYWKIAGKQMGLDKPWEPDWDQNTEKYVIYPYQYLFSVDKENYRNTILAFPTAEMRDIFYENFKDLIESCKEFL